MTNVLSTFDRSFNGTPNISILASAACLILSTNGIYFEDFFLIL